MCSGTTPTPPVTQVQATDGKTHYPFLRCSHVTEAVGASSEVRETDREIAPGPGHRRREGLRRPLRSTSVHGLGQEHLRSKGVPADESEPHVGVIVAQKSVLRLRKTIAARAHRLRATQSPPTNADVRRRMGPRGAGLFCAMHDPASAVLRRNRPTSEAPQGATTPLPGSSRCAQSADGVVSALHKAH